MRAIGVVGLVGAALIAGAAAAPRSWACSAAGKNTHVGVVLQVNAGDQQFSITDAETGRPIAFRSAPELLQPLNIGDRVVVSYEERDGGLTATRIK